MNYYKQCTLEKNNTQHVTWIPEKYATVKSCVRIKDESNTWEDGFLVKEVYQLRVAYQELMDKNASNNHFGQSIKGD